MDWVEELMTGPLQRSPHAQSPPLAEAIIAHALSLPSAAQVEDIAAIYGALPVHPLAEPAMAAGGARSTLTPFVLLQPSEAGANWFMHVHAHEA